MNSTEDLKKEISAAKQLEDITQALEQSAASFIVKTRKKILGSRSFIEEAWKTYDVVKCLSLPETKSLVTSAVVVITPNQGMSGNLTSRTIKTTQKILTELKSDLVVIGKRGAGYFRNYPTNKAHFFELPEILEYKYLEDAIDKIAEYSNITLVYPKYLSSFDQEVAVARIREVNKKKVETKLPEGAIPIKRYTFDPDYISVIKYFGKTVVGIMLYRYIIESVLAYKASQMVAMKNAYDNAKEIREETTFKYFRSNREIVDSKLRELTAARNLLGEE